MEVRRTRSWMEERKEIEGGNEGDEMREEGLMKKRKELREIKREGGLGKRVYVRERGGAWIWMEGWGEEEGAEGVRAGEE